MGVLQAVAGCCGLRGIGEQLCGLLGAVPPAVLTSPPPPPSLSYLCQQTAESRSDVLICLPCHCLFGAPKCVALNGLRHRCFGRCVASIACHRSRITGVCWSSLHPTTVYSCAEDHLVRAYDFSKGSEHTDDPPAATRCMCATGARPCG